MNAILKKGICASVGGGALLCGVAAFAQVGGNGTPTGGSLKTLRFISSLEANDNYDLRSDSAGNALIWTNTIEYNQKYVTDVDSFDGTASGDLRFADLPVVGADNSLDNGTVRANYARRIDDNSFGFYVYFNDADIDYLDPLRSLDDSGGLDDLQGQGRRSLLNTRASLDLNEDGPISFSLQAGYRNTDYRDVTDDSLNDKTSYNVTAETGLDVATGYRVLFGGTYSGYDEDDGDNNQRYEIYTGLRASPTPTGTFTARFGYSEINTEQNGVEDDYTGDVAQFSYTEDLPNGDVTLAFSSRLYETGRRNQISVGRSLALPTGSLSGSIGLSNNDNFDARPYAGLSYVVVRPTSRLAFGFNQNFDVDDDGNDVLNGSLNASYTQQVNPVSSFTLSALAASRVQLDDDSADQDINRVTLTARYNHSITRDWQVSTGVTHRSRFEEDEGDSQSNAVFLNLTRTFTSR